jgi:hypothetical protein
LEEKAGRPAMTDNSEIEQLRASLDRTKTGTEALVLCVAQVLCERDPSFRVLLEEKLETAYAILESRSDREAAEMVGRFGRALVDPAFKFPRI